MNNLIQIVENYLNKDTCNFIRETLNPLTKFTEQKSTTGWWPASKYGAHEVKPGIPISPYIDNKNYDICMDILTLLVVNMSKTISDFYKEEYILKSLFFGKMEIGGFNGLHMDNKYLSSADKQIKDRPNAQEDKSGLLYLNQDYTGGNLIFPLQNLEIKPNSGTFIFFQGDEKVPHFVSEVTSGTRNNIICFFGKKNKGFDRSVEPVGDLEAKLELNNFN